MDVNDVFGFLEERDLDIAVFTPLLSKNLDANVIVLVGRKTVIVAVDLAVEDDRGSSGGERFARHSEFFRIRRLKTFGMRRGGRKYGPGED
jgi:hypothetical protein